MDIIGDGELKADIHRQIMEHHLEKSVTMHGFIAPDQVRNYMDRADIFLFTSDFHEGWGAVLNEAMNSGCACVASHAIGAAPYLIHDGENGFLYRNGDTQQLCNQVETLVKNTSLCRTVGLNAYRTIADTWNADAAAKRLIAFCKAIKHQEKAPEYQDGPMSKARFLSNHWYHKGRRDVKLMEKEIVITEKICTGCHACFSICPKRAIEMKPDERGFLQPVINYDLCIGCKLCQKTCPLNTADMNSAGDPIANAAYSLNDENHRNSSSGGIFSLLASEILREGGTVYGAAFTEDFRVEHKRITNDIRPLQTSKYVQSRIGDMFSCVEQDIRNGQKVLFSGTPC